MTDESLESLSEPLLEELELLLELWRRFFLAGLGGVADFGAGLGTASTGVSSFFPSCLGVLSAEGLGEGSFLSSQRDLGGKTAINSALSCPIFCLPPSAAFSPSFGALSPLLSSSSFFLRFGDRDLDLDDDEDDDDEEEDDECDLRFGAAERSLDRDRDLRSLDRDLDFPFSSTFSSDF